MQHILTFIFHRTSAALVPNLEGTIVYSLPDFLSLAFMSVCMYSTPIKDFRVQGFSCIRDIDGLETEAAIKIGRPEKQKKAVLPMKVV
jgi:hypothetical protein